MVLSSKLSIGVKTEKTLVRLLSWYTKFNRLSELWVSMLTAQVSLKLHSGFDNSRKTLNAVYRIRTVMDKGICPLPAMIVTTWVAIQTSVAGGQMWNTLHPVGNNSGLSERECAETQTLWTHQSLYTLLTSSGISAELQVNEWTTKWMTNSLQNNGCVQNHSTIWSFRT